MDSKTETVSDNCPTDDFEEGQANGKCWGDGHYRCQECIHYRKDFKTHGQPLIDFAHQIQSFQISTLPIPRHN